MKTLPTGLARILASALFASIASLGVAFISQYGFGLTPCELCILQRVPYAIVIVLALGGLITKRALYALCMITGLCFAADSAIAAYHTAVEKHWVAGPEACTSKAPGAPETIEETLARIKGAPIVACDQPQWESHGVTMAMLNAIWALGLAISTFGAVQHFKRKGAIHA